MSKPINKQFFEVEEIYFKKYYDKIKRHIKQEDIWIITELDIYRTLMWKHTAPIASILDNEDSDKREFWINKGIEKYLNECDKNANN